MQTTFQPPSARIELHKNKSNMQKITQQREERVDYEDEYQNGHNKRVKKKNHINQMGLDHPLLHCSPSLHTPSPSLHLQFLSIIHSPLQLELVKMGYRTDSSITISTTEAVSVTSSISTRTAPRAP
ncbi:hypothetical protein L873DRAFT_701071 [Choiromyces venosus 120613-1]|uniref:Uncharacterized protein n=1 Tax=Choiromyces venosus 120613-1 TaxID=1336337 RepID=A0A3N4IYH2_9PEZI|nr:hypothetical protein L873DRAFT_701071 [Choiromyces venosus 120613-1]